MNYIIYSKNTFDIKNIRGGVDLLINQIVIMLNLNNY